MLEKQTDKGRTQQKSGSFLGTVPAAQPSESQTLQQRKTEEISGEKPLESGDFPSDADKEKETEVPKAPQISMEGDAISFFFDDADIFEVAQTVFGDVLKVNYIIDPKVSGRVNFRTVSPIPVGEVLSVMEIIFRLNGIGFVVENGLYRIMPLNDVARELIYAQVGKDPDSVAMELFVFKNVSLKDSIKEIENTIGLSVRGGYIRALPIYRLNALLVVASSYGQLEYVRKWVQTFDVMFDNARPKVYVYPVQNSKAKDVADILHQIFFEGKSSSPAKTAPPQKNTQQRQGESVSAPVPPVSFTLSGGASLVSEITRIFPDDKANSIIILSTPEDYELISETITKIDIVPRQVMIEALVASLTLADNLRFGLQWTIQNDLMIKGLWPFTEDIDISGALELNTPSSSSAFSYTSLDEAGNIKLLIQALAEDNKAKVLSAPHILVSDNREAKIQVGDQVPIATQLTTNTETTPAQTTTTIQYKDTGTILKVKPQVNDSGLVALEITQEVSVADTTQVLGTEQFVIRKREVTTNLVAQDGQTIVIGGLIDEQTTKARTGIPVLSRIPVLGYLFGSTIDDTTRTELVILLTPRVIKNQAQASSVSTDYLQRVKEVEKEINKKGILIKDIEPEQEDGNHPVPGKAR
jgi:general secretion pathway protein D